MFVYFGSVASALLALFSGIRTRVRTRAYVYVLACDSQRIESLDRE